MVVSELSAESQEYEKDEKAKGQIIGFWSDKDWLNMQTKNQKKMQPKAKGVK